MGLFLLPPKGNPLLKVLLPGLVEPVAGESLNCVQN